jgi:hypothetical protein
MEPTPELNANIDQALADAELWREFRRHNAGVCGIANLPTR